MDMFFPLMDVDTFLEVSFWLCIILLGAIAYVGVLITNDLNKLETYYEYTVEEYYEHIN